MEDKLMIKKLQGGLFNENNTSYDPTLCLFSVVTVEMLFKFDILCSKLH